ncbi:MAG TPA: hypothetical protein VFR02_04150, partial [bacterium]|nr:hypothetical protein [bacterium]
VAEVAPGSYGTRVFDSARYGAGVRAKGSPYAAFTQQVESLARAEAAKARPPREVAELILRVVQGRALKPVYLAGPDAKALNFLKWLLPDGIFEWLFSRFFPWSRPPKRR